MSCYLLFVVSSTCLLHVIIKSTSYSSWDWFPSRRNVALVAIVVSSSWSLVPFTIIWSMALCMINIVILIHYKLLIIIISTRRIKRRNVHYYKLISFRMNGNPSLITTLFGWILTQSQSQMMTTMLWSIHSRRLEITLISLIRQSRQYLWTVISAALMRFQTIWNSRLGKEVSFYSILLEDFPSWMRQVPRHWH